MTQDKRFPRAVVLAASLTMMVTQPATAQSDSLSAQSQAQKILARAIQAAGGSDALDALRTNKVTFSTQAAAIGQGPTPETEPTLRDPFRTIAYRSGGQLSIENFNGDNVGFRLVLGNEPDWAWLAGQNAVADIGPAVSGRIVDRVSTSGHVLVELSGRSEALRATGQKTIDGNSYQTLSYADEFGRLQSLAFDSQTGHLAQMERLEAHPQWGDITNVVSYGDYKKAGDAVVSHLITIKEAGTVITKANVENFEFVAADSSLFTKPEDAGENPPINGPDNSARDLTVEELGDRIYFIPNAAQGYNAMFVDQHDGVLIVETPQSPQAGRDIVQAVKAKLPGKKIKFAVPTHHHFDHSGGLYGFIEAGIPILTTPGNTGFVNKVASADRNIGQASAAAGKPSVQSFEGQRTEGRGDQQVQLIDMGPNPHAEEIVVAYLPSIKTLFVADIYSFRGGNVVAANANQLAFADKLQELDLDIDTFIPVHGDKATADQFWESVKLGREAQEQE